MDFNKEDQEQSKDHLSVPGVRGDRESTNEEAFMSPMNSMVDIQENHDSQNLNVPSQGRSPK